MKRTISLIAYMSLCVLINDSYASFPPYPFETDDWYVVKVGVLNDAGQKCIINDKEIFPGDWYSARTDQRSYPFILTISINGKTEKIEIKKKGVIYGDQRLNYTVTELIPSLLKLP